MMGVFTRKSLDVAAIFLASFDHQFLNAFFSQFLSIFLSELICIKESKRFTSKKYTEYRKMSITTDSGGYWVRRMRQLPQVLLF